MMKIYLIVLKKLNKTGILLNRNWTKIVQTYNINLKNNNNSPSLKRVRHSTVLNPIQLKSRKSYIKFEK